MSDTLQLHPVTPETRKLKMAAEALDSGAVAFYPTDTVYALGCALDARRSVDRLYRLKRMDQRQPLSLICGEIREIARYAVVTDYAYRQLRRFLPGPYTFLLAATREVPRVLLDKRRVIGVRVSSCRVTQDLVATLGRPLITTSAVPPGEETAAIDVEAAKAAWPSGIDLFIDGGPTPGAPSTVVSLLDDQFEVIRQGLGEI